MRTGLLSLADLPGFRANFGKRRQRGAEILTLAGAAVRKEDVFSIFSLDKYPKEDYKIKLSFAK
jgi:hypothetical protein